MKKKNNSGRRDFLRLTSMALSGLPLSPVISPGQKASAFGLAGAPVERKLHVVCVGAHPGDPEFGCGGTMAKYSDAGHSVTFLYLTRGEAGDPTKTFEESALLRTKEAEEACRLLQVKALFAGQVDANTVLDKDQNEKMAKLIASESPDLVFTHWPLDAHPDHQVAGLLVLTAWIRSGRKFQLYFYEVNTGSETMSFTPTDYVDISETRDKKKSAMFAHKTQDPRNVYNAYFKAMEEFRGLEAGVTAAEGFIHFKDGVTRARIDFGSSV
jgi:LmbE family N-acetylglucosaminyl deacetylase